MRTRSFIVALAAVGALSVSALAQNDPPRQRRNGENAPAARQRPDGAGQPGERPAGARREPMSPEKAKAAWDLEATGVAKRLKLSDEQTKAVAKAYGDARKSHEEASTKLREELVKKARENNKDGNDNGGPGGGPGGRGGMGPEAMKAMEDLNKKEAEKLKTALGATISGDQLTKAMASLGAFNRQWDGMANAIGDFKLEAAKQQTALEAVEDYVVTMGKARGGDPQDMRDAMQDARKKLTDSLKPVLSEDQMKKFEETTRGGGMRGGPGGGGRGGRGGDGQGPGPGGG